MTQEEVINNLIDVINNPVIKSCLVIIAAILAQHLLKAALKGLLIMQAKSDTNHTNRRDRQKRIKTLNSIAGATASLVVWIIAVLTIMGIFNVPIAPLLTGAGLIGAAIAFGMQSLIKDFISGIFIIAENQYRVDDYVKLDKVEGYVESISVRTTVIRDDDGSLHHVPNGIIAVTTNMSVGRLKAHEQFEIDTKYSIKELETKLQEIAENIKTNHELTTYIKEGPWFVGVDKATAKSTTVSIAFTTSAPKRTKGSHIIWQQIIDKKIPLV